MRTTLVIGIIAAGVLLWLVSQPEELVQPKSEEVAVSAEATTEKTTTFTTATTTTTASATTMVQLGDVVFPAEVADTPAKRAQGLSDSTALPEDELLLFVFERSDQHSFWMKDMHFAIDIIWLDENGEVVYVKENVSPNTFPESFAPESPARYVLEATAGFAARHGVEKGTQFTLPAEY